MWFTYYVIIIYWMILLPALFQQVLDIGWTIWCWHNKILFVYGNRSISVFIIFGWFYDWLIVNSLGNSAKIPTWRSKLSQNAQILAETVANLVHKAGHTCATPQNVLNFTSSSLYLPFSSLFFFSLCGLVYFFLALAFDFIWYVII